ncbi:TPA: phage holin family protein [Escherichia coli]
MLGYAIIPLRWLYGTYTQSSWLVVVLNLVFCALIVWSRGNVSKILSLLRC